MAGNSDYFATRLAREVVAHLEDARKSYLLNLGRQGVRERCRKSFNLYYGKHFEAGARSQTLVRGGAKGELVAFALNHYRNLIRHTLAITTAQKPSFDVRAEVTDPDALNDAKLGNQILENDYKFKYWGDKLYGAAERAQVFGKGHVVSIWHHGRGKPYGRKEVTKRDGTPHLDSDGSQMNQIVYEGDIEDANPGPFDVMIDQGLEDHRKARWAEIRLYDNKYDLAALYPALADRIVGLQTKHEIDYLSGTFFSTTLDVETDEVPVYYWVHKASPALPMGRMIVFCSEDVILSDGPAPDPYSTTIPAFRIVPGEIFGTTEGWSDAFDLQGIQEALNILVSIGFTNTQANGLQKLWVPESSNISSSALMKGLAIIRSAQKPEPLQLTANPGDLAGQLNFLVKSAETISGINSVARGDPEHSLKSGIALAYVEAMAAQYVSPFQRSWASLCEEVATFRLDLYKNFATTERLIDLVGKRNLGYVASFKGDKIKRVRRVVVDMGNPLTRSMGGRLEVAQDLKDMGQIQTPQDYLTFLETGSFGTITEDSYDVEAAIHLENQMLMDGKPVKAIPGEKHMLHAQKHLALISNPEIRMSARYVSAVLAHVQEHVQLKKTEDPVMSMISGEPPLPQPAPPPPQPPGPPGAPPQAPGGPVGPMPPGPRMGPPGMPHPPHLLPPQPHPGHPAHAGKGHAGPERLGQALMPQPAVPPIPRLGPGLQPGMIPGQPPAPGPGPIKP